VQHGFHREIHALYDDPGLEVLLPDLVDRRRLGLIVLDLEDLGVGVPTWRNAPRFVHGAIDLPEALGWLYVAEGSNLGAAFLFKWAGALKLHARHGARHLAAAPEGRANQWRAFTSVLDEILMTEAEEERLTAGARAAFLHVHGLVSDVFDKG
jgi:heme oxygenase